MTAISKPNEKGAACEWKDRVMTWDLDPGVLFYQNESYGMDDFPSFIASYFNPGKALASLNINNAKRSAHWVMQIFKDQPYGFTDIQHLSLALDNGINHKVFSSDEINQILKILSPFENNSTTPWLEKNYNRDQLLVRGGRSYGQKFNGLYQDLAYLYAAAGRPEMALQCIDTILQYQETYYQNDYTTHIENASNIAAVFYTYGMTNQLDEFVQGYCKRKHQYRSHLPVSKGL